MTDFAMLRVELEIGKHALLRAIRPEVIEAEVKKTLDRFCEGDALQALVEKAVRSELERHVRSAASACVLGAMDDIRARVEGAVRKDFSAALLSELDKEPG